MPKLFLASSLNLTILNFIKIAKIADSKNLNVGFIDIASEPYRGKIDLFWVDNDRKAFMKNNFKVTNLDLNSYKGDFMEFNILHFCGGHTRYLLSKIHKLGHFDSIRSAITNKNIIYTGTSAGSMIVAPSLVGAGQLDDDINEKFSLKKQEGLNLVNFLILPHFNNPNFIASNHQSIQSTNYPYPLIFLNDNSAIWVDSNQFQIIQN